MTEPIQPTAPAATPTTAPAPITPAVPPAATPPAAPPASAAPVNPTAPAKTLLEQAGETTAPNIDETIESYHQATEAYMADPTPENKAAMEKAAGEVKTQASALKTSAAPAALPEKYEMTAAEGKAIDEALLTEITPILKEAGISNDVLNKLGPIAEKIQEKAIAAYVAHKASEDAALVAKETAESKAALGAKWQEQLGLVAKVRDRFFSDESKAILAKNGNNIHLINDLIKLGKSISEGKIVDGKPAGEKKDAASVLFPTMAQT